MAENESRRPRICVLYLELTSKVNYKKKENLKIIAHFLDFRLWVPNLLMQKFLHPVEIFAI